ALVCAGGTFYPHYFVFGIPAASILIAAALSVAGETKTPWKWGAGLYFLSFPLFFLSQSLAFTSTKGGIMERFFTCTHFFNDAVSWAEWLKRNTSPSERVFVFGSEPEILYYAQRKCVGRYCYVYPLTFPTTAVAAQKETERAISSTPPEMIIAVASPTSQMV